MKKFKGFTLIELLIVISIIGILAVALLPNILSAPATARDAGRKAELNSVLSALEQYKAANGEYPTTTDGCLPGSLTNFFKGNKLPTGAPLKATGNILACKPANAVVDPTNVAYCPLSKDTHGYSYIVAIQMENQLTGTGSAGAEKNNNVLKPTVTTCPDSYSEATVNALSSENSYWYYIVQ